jgi:hypothetical protein
MAKMAFLPPVLSRKKRESVVAGLHTQTGSNPSQVTPYFRKKAIIFCNGGLDGIQTRIMVRLPGFEPGSSTWQAEVLNQARLQPHMLLELEPDFA